MPSHLTRQVFRSLLANEPIVHRGCLRRQVYSNAAHTSGRPRATPRIGVARITQQRLFFNFSIFGKPQREIKDADMVPGMEKMRELEKMQRMRARLPPSEEVAKAFVQLVKAKEASKRPMEDTEADLALRSIRFILAEESKSEGPKTRAEPLLTMSILARAARVVGVKPKGVSEAHLSLARLLYDQLRVNGSSYHTFQARLSLCKLLCDFGTPEKARDVLLKHEQSAASPATSTNPIEDNEDGAVEDDAHNENMSRVTPNAGGVVLWTRILRAFGKQGDVAEVRRTFEMIRERGLERHTRVQRAMLDASLIQGDLAEIQQWWREWQTTRARIYEDKSEPLRNVAASTDTIRSLLRWCASSGNLDFGHEVVRTVMQDNPPKPVWDAVFVWAAMIGKGVDEIGRMIGVMDNSNEVIADRSNWRRPDIVTINSLVEFAISKNDPYMAERFIALGRERGMEPDARTYVLQMEYRLSVGDADGALTAYKSLQAMDVSSDEDVPTVNKLIVALCNGKRHDFDTVMNVAADLSDRRERFEPSTVSTLALLHLSRDEIHDVIDLLNTHAFHFSSSERADVRDALVAYCLDQSTPTSCAWDAYTIIRQVFDELSREPRTQLMSLFFQHDRPDMAVHVFNHMRAHSRADTIPTVDTYVTAFMGAAKRHDIESLEVLHNQLKLDYNIDLNTYLRNALIIAYTACDKPRKALQFWDDIVASREGPTYNSIHIALRACERSPFGDIKAKEIWEKLRKMNIELDRTMWASYVAAIAGNGDVRGGVRILEQAEENGDVEVDEFVLGSLFMSAPGMVKQGEVEVWAKEKYLEVWEDLVGMGMDEDEAGERTVKIDRSVTP